MYFFICLIGVNVSGVKRSKHGTLANLSNHADTVFFQNNESMSKELVVVQHP